MVAELGPTRPATGELSASAGVAVAVSGQRSLMAFMAPSLSVKRGEGKFSLGTGARSSSARHSRREQLSETNEIMRLLSSMILSASLALGAMALETLRAEGATQTGCMSGDSLADGRGPRPRGAVGDNVHRWQVRIWRGECAGDDSALRLETHRGPVAFLLSGSAAADSPLR
jgi:hypothetical protein